MPVGEEREKAEWGNGEGNRRTAFCRFSDNLKTLMKHKFLEFFSIQNSKISNISTIHGLFGKMITQIHRTDGTGNQRNQIKREFALPTDTPGFLNFHNFH